MKSKIAVALALGLLMLGSLAAPVTATPTSSTVAVSFDFGNGLIAWTEVTITPGMNMLNATETAASQLGYALGDAGGFVSNVNGYIGNWPDEAWGLFLWNTTNHAWDSATKGASQIEATNATAISWHYAIFRMDWTQAPSLATPDHRYPWASSRQNNLNTGSQPAYAPNNITSKWSKDLVRGSIYAPVVAVGGFEYVIASGNFTPVSNATITCLDSNGDQVWQHEIGRGYLIAAPLVKDDMVIAPSADGRVYAFNRTDGLPIWTFDTHSNTSYGVISSPVEFREDIIVATSTGKVFRLHDNGAQVWNVTVAPLIYSSSPAIRNETIYVGSDDGKLHAINTETGIETWNVSVGGKVRGSPILSDVGIVCTYNNYSGGSAVTGGLVRIDFSGHILKYAQIGITPGSAALTLSGAVAVTPTTMYMINPAGQVLWSTPLGTSGAFSSGAPTAVGGTIFTVTDEAHSRLIAVSEKGVIYAQYALTPANYAIAAPTVADGVLYCAGDNGVVYAFNLNTVAPSPSSDFSVSKHNLTTTFSTPSTPGTLFEHAWSFGDGTHGAGLSASHTYAAAGTYNVTLTISNAAGQKLNVSKSTTVHAFTAPRSLTAVAGQGKVTLTWLAPLDSGDSPVAMYHIYRSTSGTSPTMIAVVSASTLTYSDTNCTAGTNYTYYVSAMNALDMGPASNTASAVPQSTPTTDNTLLYVGIIVVIVVVAAIAALLVMRGRKK